MFCVLFIYLKVLSQAGEEGLLKETQFNVTCFEGHLLGWTRQK